MINTLFSQVVDFDILILADLLRLRGYRMLMTIVHNFRNVFSLVNVSVYLF